MIMIISANIKNRFMSSKMQKKWKNNIGNIFKILCLYVRTLQLIKNRNFQMTKKLWRKKSMIMKISANVKNCFTSSKMPKNQKKIFGNIFKIFFENQQICAENWSRVRIFNMLEISNG